MEKGGQRMRNETKVRSVQVFLFPKFLQRHFDLKTLRRLTTGSNYLERSNNVLGCFGYLVSVLWLRYFFLIYLGFLSVYPLLCFIGVRVFLFCASCFTLKVLLCSFCVSLHFLPFFSGFPWLAWCSAPVLLLPALLPVFECWCFPVFLSAFCNSWWPFLEFSWTSHLFWSPALFFFV